MAVAETSLVKKNHQLATIVNQQITQKTNRESPYNCQRQKFAVQALNVT